MIAHILAQNVSRRENFLDAEKYHLEKAQSFRYLHHLQISRLFEDPMTRLKSSPRFFSNTEKSGEELRNGFATLWATFILAVTEMFEPLGVVDLRLVSHEGNSI